ncbi:hypothetical protein HNR44_000450 [Geomicrobium halophilum]|uniref:Uncharacterized protein n=1 Tax=Geomicrobium halophilum TaxID=549000 RepID=A0A841PQB3_9BACL|nr:hypothetical protein [Geomicrobium halophilum]MBB6448501.1 hypothetical protein [Geomicrobium halophilum]
MGYIPMQANDIALQYGSRIQSVQPLVKANPRVEAITARNYRKRRYQSLPLMVYHDGRKVHEIEPYSNGKGQRFEALA